MRTITQGRIAVRKDISSPLSPVQTAVPTVGTDGFPTLDRLPQPEAAPGQPEAAARPTETSGNRGLVEDVIAKLRDAASVLGDLTDRLRTVDKTQVADLGSMLKLAATVEGNFESVTAMADRLETDTLVRLDEVEREQIPYSTAPNMEGALAP
jgi:hypothetical protein